MIRAIIGVLSKLFDVIGLLLTPFAATLARLQSRFGPQRLPMSYGIWDRMGVLPVPYHYYQPVFDVRSIPDEAWEKQDPLLGVDLRVDDQLALLGKFDNAAELKKISWKKRPGSLDYYYSNASFLAGDSEILYNVIRHYHPRKMIEIGSGFSTRMAKAALDQNRKEGDGASHICIEPFEMPWLERLKDTEILRSRVEEVDLGIFGELGENDILFIDSSHVLRMGGDVYVEYLKILPTLRKGVIVHIHDIYWPFDYPRGFVKSKRYFWTEQYLLQAFLAFNRDYEVMLALNYLATHHKDALDKACPVFAQHPGITPGSFWMRRV